MTVIGMPATNLDPTEAQARLDAPNLRFEDWDRDARYFEYSKAADPIAVGTISGIPAAVFGPETYASGPTRVILLDLRFERFPWARRRSGDEPGAAGELPAHFGKRAAVDVA